MTDKNIPNKNIPGKKIPLSEDAGAGSPATADLVDGLVNDEETSKPAPPEDDGEGN